MNLKKMQTRSKDNNSNIKVVVRIRPQNSIEQNEKYQIVTEAINDRMLVFDPKTNRNRDTGFLLKEKKRDITNRRFKDLKYAFDYVFKPSASNRDIYEETTRDIISNVLKGFNCTVFAYGATGSGKTHTMLGSEKEPGVIYYTMIKLYEQISALKEEKSCGVAVSYLEVYNENVRDLLMPRKNLPIREDKSVGVIISGLSLHKPENADELLSMLQYGNKNRTQHPTDANAESSRSHAVFQVYVKQRPRASSANPEVSIAKMSLVDLAGSERASKNRNCGLRLREGANINRSLLALGNVINALADNKSKGFIPYRDSKLTRLLKDSLGGNCQTIMIATVSPSSHSFEDTYNTLRYADRAKLIKTDLKQNVLSIDQHIVNYKKYVVDLENENRELREANSRLEESSKRSSRSQILSSNLKQCQNRLEDLFKNRRSLVKAWIHAEITQRELKWKMSRKERAVRRIERLTGSRDVISKHKRIIERMKRLSSKEETNLEKSLEQLKKQDEAISKFYSEMGVSYSSDDVGVEFLNLNVQLQRAESLLLDSGTYLGFVKRMARAQERQSAVNERLILSLIKVAKKQHDIIQSQGLSNVDLDAEYMNCCYMVEEKGVSWVQQHSGKKEDAGAVVSPASRAQDVEEDFSVSEIIDIKMPTLNLEGFQGRGNHRFSQQTESGPQRVLTHSTSKPATRSLADGVYNTENKKMRTESDQVGYPLLKLPVVEPEPMTFTVEEDEVLACPTAQPSPRYTLGLRVPHEKQQSVPTSTKDANHGSESRVKTLVDKYSRSLVQSPRTVVSPKETKVSHSPSRSRTPLARKKLQWESKEEAKSSVIALSLAAANTLNSSGDGQCESCVESTGSDALNTTFEIDKPAIPNTPCIDDKVIRFKRQGNRDGHVLDQGPVRRSSNPAFPVPHLTASRQNLTPRESKETTSATAILRSKELSHTPEDQPHPHNLRSKHSVSGLDTPTGPSDSGMRLRKRPLSMDGLSQRSKCKSSISPSVSNHSLPSKGINSNSHSSQTSLQPINVNQSCTTIASTDETCLYDSVSPVQSTNVGNPCLSSTPENDIRFSKESVEVPEYNVNPYMQHVINSLKKHGKPSLTAMLLPSSSKPSSFDINEPLPLGFLDVNKTNEKWKEKSNPVAVSNTTVKLEHMEHMARNDTNPLKARLDRLRERRHFRSIASKPYSRVGNSDRNKFGLGMSKKVENDRNAQESSKPSYMLPTFAASQKMFGADQSRPSRTCASKAPLKQMHSQRSSIWNKS